MTEAVWKDWTSVTCLAGLLQPSPKSLDIVLNVNTKRSQWFANLQLTNGINILEYSTCICIIYVVMMTYDIIIMTSYEYDIIMTSYNDNYDI